jgi:peptidoglycan/LPS O-acetylase OafA/YrhL
MPGYAGFDEPSLPAPGTGNPTHDESGVPAMGLETDVALEPTVVTNSRLESGDRILWLDSLRALAVLAVVLVHCGQIARSSGFLGHVTSAGQYGVQLFFVISAVTISLTYQKHVQKYGSSLQSMFAWFVRRIFRIAPLYYIAAIVYSVEHLILNHRFGSSLYLKPQWGDFAANLLFVHTWVPSANNSIVPGGWSIGVEVMFYALFPMCMLWNRKSYFKAFLLTVALASVVFSELVNYEISGNLLISSNSYLYLWFPTQFPVILIGCAFFFAYLDGKTTQTYPHFLGACLLFVLFSALSLALGTWGELSPGLSPSTFAVAFCCVALIVRGDRIGMISNRLLSRVGACSYSIYIVHFALLDVARLMVKALSIRHFQSSVLLLFSIYVPVCIGSYYLAVFTRRLVEVPGIELGHRLSSLLLPRRSAIVQKARESDVAKSEVSVFPV